LVAKGSAGMGIEVEESYMYGRTGRGVEAEAYTYSETDRQRV